MNLNSTTRELEVSSTCDLLFLSKSLSVSSIFLEIDRKKPRTPRRRSNVHSYKGSQHQLRLVTQRPALSITSTATASNRAGPGRALGNLYSRAGRILERWVASIAHDLGYGPYATEEQLLRLFDGIVVQHRTQSSGDSVSGIQCSGIEEQTFLKHCRRLSAYSM